MVDLFQFEKIDNKGSSQIRKAYLKTNREKKKTKPQNIQILDIEEF